MKAKQSPSLKPLLLILSSIVLSSCNSGSNNQLSTIGGVKSKAGSSSGGEQASSYQGSQAYNSSLYAGETVNEQTGSLSLSRSLISVAGVMKDIGLDFNLIYTSTASGKSILHLPEGWSYQLSYVIPDKSANIDGNNYVLDDGWRDSSGYGSGLKYINNHSIKFTSVAPDQKLSCNGDGRYYHYKYTGVDGGHQYFDTQGKLLARDNRFGSCISYYYNDHGDIYNSYLDHIVDSYGNNFTFRYESNRVSVVNNGKVVSSFSYTNNGVVSYSDAMGYTTSYNYAMVSGKNLVSHILYPSGLKTSIQYAGLNYKNCDTGAGTQAAVSLLTKSSGSSVIAQTGYTYGDATGGSNFSGYNLGFCLGGVTDQLEDSNNHGFLYDVTVKKFGSAGAPSEITRTYYNFLHLPIRQERLNSSGKVNFLTKFSYDISPDKHIRSGSYALPIKEEVVSGGTTVLVKNSSYNNYNQMLHSQTSILKDGKLTPYSSTSANYFPAVPYIPSETIDKDDVNGGTIKTVNTLDDSMVNIASSLISYSGKGWKRLNYSYDKLGRLISEQMVGLGVSGGSSKSYSYSYDNGILSVTETDALGHSVVRKTNVLLPGSPVIKETSPGGHTISYEYDAAGRELSMTSPMGHSYKTRYLVAQKDGSNAVVKTNPLGYTQTINYDALGRPVSVRDNGGNGNRVLEQVSYSLLGLPLSKTDMLRNTTSYKYDEYGREIETKDPSGNQTTINYNDGGLSSTTYINGILRGTSVTDGAGNALQSISYSADGKMNSVTTDYNGFGGKIKEISQAEGKQDTQTSYVYDGDGNVVSTNMVKYDGTTVSINSQYDALGNVLSKVTSISGKGSVNSNVNSYNAIGQLVQSTNPIGQTKTFKYDADGNLVSTKNYDGTSSNYSYDGDGNQTSVTHAGISTSSTYDALGNVLSISSEQGSINYSYNLTGDVLGVSYPDGKTMSYEYNSNGQLISKTNAFGVKSNYSYDHLGRLTGINGTSDQINYEYGDGKLISGQYGMLISKNLSGSNPVNHSYGYDGWGRISSDNVQSGIHSISMQVKRDWLGKIVEETTSSPSKVSSWNVHKRFSYDGLGHLLSSNADYTEADGKITKMEEAYTYDKNSNVTRYVKDGVTNTYSYNGLDQLTSVNGKAISYDKAGNMLNDDESGVYSYNGLNQLIAVSKGGTTTTYNYYPDGMLRSRDNGGNGVTFYYDGENADGVLVRKQGAMYQDSLLLDEGGKAVASYRNGEGSYYLALGGSTLGLLGKDGSIKNSYKYAGYGKTSSDNKDDEGQSFLWNQEYEDRDTNLVYLRARFYNPRLMRFMNADTYDVANLYNYGNGDPINNIDPSGHLSQEAVRNIAFGATAGAVAIASIIAAPFTGGASLAIGVAASAIDVGLATGNVITGALQKNLNGGDWAWLGVSLALAPVPVIAEGAAALVKNARATAAAAEEASRNAAGMAKKNLIQEVQDRLNSMSKVSITNSDESLSSSAELFVAKTIALRDKFKSINGSTNAVMNLIDSDVNFIEETDVHIFKGFDLTKDGENKFLYGDIVELFTNRNARLKALDMNLKSRGSFLKEQSSSSIFFFKPKGNLRPRQLLPLQQNLQLQQDKVNKFKLGFDEFIIPQIQIGYDNRIPIGQ